MRTQGESSLTLEQDPTEFDEITELPNGIRVATEALPGPFSGVGVYLHAGSRYENEELRGVSHIVDRLAFKVCYACTVIQPTLIEVFSPPAPDRQTRC